MKQNVLGIDLGTSSVKLLLWHEDGTMEKAKASYDGIGCQSWMNALRLALKQLDVSSVTELFRRILQIVRDISLNQDTKSPVQKNKCIDKIL